jgi:hypothetical protein
MISGPKDILLPWCWQSLCGEKDDLGLKSMAVRGEGDAGSCGYAFGSSTERFQSPRPDRGEAARDNLRGQDINHNTVHCKKKDATCQTLPGPNHYYLHCKKGCHLPNSPRP